MKYNLRTWEKGAITGCMIYFGLLFLAGMCVDQGHLYININKYYEGWVETILLIYLAIRSIWSWFEK